MSVTFLFIKMLGKYKNVKNVKKHDKNKKRKKTFLRLWFSPVIIEYTSISNFNAIRNSEAELMI